ncbi:phosphopantetheine-binding protein [Streptomyces sp. NPDC005283]|uniref:phosphopantetheine-binding protein n=1 Tax=Streptomyces sp. NPDC005283 TaxID=3156871 RepID=UPI0034559AB8
MADRQLILDTVFQRLREVIPALRDGEPDAEKDLREYPEFDSLGVLEILVWLESEFSLVIPDEELVVDRFSTPAKIVDYIVASQS